MSFFDKIKNALVKTKSSVLGQVDSLVKSFVKIDEDLLEELEEILIMSDMGMTTTSAIMDRLRAQIKEEKIKGPEQVKTALEQIIGDMLDCPEEERRLRLEAKPTVILVVGVNGVGKTTTIAKIANILKQEGKKVILAAADTFRAAAIDQLDIWAQRLEMDIVKHQEGSDPAAVIFDTIAAAKARDADVILCDTAGRLHNKKNLMNELAKIYKVISRELPDSEFETLLVMDATTGQNALVQAKEFKQAADITGIVITKLDGTAKGGAVVAVRNELDVPVKYIGVGERMDDLMPFQAREFAKALFE